MTKVCRACKVDKRLAEFPFLPSRDRHLACCRDCVRERSRGYRKAAASSQRKPRLARPPRHTINPVLLHAAHSKDTEARPVCPCCKERSPRIGRSYSREWLMPWGHRCPHGDPCPAWLTALPEGVEACKLCATNLPRTVPNPAAAAVVERRAYLTPARLQRLREKLRAILNAAHDLFEEKGELHMLELARRARVGTGTVYHFFDNCDQLREALADSLDVDEIIESIVPGLTRVAVIDA